MSSAAPVIGQLSKPIKSQLWLLITTPLFLSPFPPPPFLSPPPPPLPESPISIAVEVDFFSYEFVNFDRENELKVLVVTDVTSSLYKKCIYIKL